MSVAAMGLRTWSPKLADSPQPRIVSGFVDRETQTPRHKAGAVAARSVVPEGDLHHNADGDGLAVDHGGLKPPLLDGLNGIVIQA